MTDDQSADLSLSDESKGLTEGFDPEVVPPDSIAPEDGPWSFKRFPPMERDMAIKAAKRAKKTVPDYVAEAIRAHIDSERAESSGFDLFPPGQEVATIESHSPAPLSVHDIGEAIAIMRTIAELRGKAIPPRALASAQRALMRRLS